MSFSRGIPAWRGSGQAVPGTSERALRSRGRRDGAPHAHPARASPGDQAQVALPLDVRLSGPRPSRVAGPMSPKSGPTEEGSAAPRLPLARPTAGGLRGRAGRVPVGWLPSREVAAAVRVAAAEVCLWVPPDAAGPRAHTHPRAHAPPCGTSRPWTPPLGGAREPSPGRRGVRGGGVRTLGSQPPRSGCAPPPQPQLARGLGLWRRHPWPAGVPEAAGRAADGVGRGWGAAGRQPAPLRAGKVWTWETPSRPTRREEGARRGRRGHLGSPCGGRLAPAGQGAPSRPGSLPWAAIRPPLPRHPALLPRGAARGSPQSCRLGTLRGAGAPARARESGARRPPGGA